MTLCVSYQLELLRLNGKVPKNKDQIESAHSTKNNLGQIKRQRGLT
jgi:hypothetical protein